ncbi:MAG: hypothetical protein Q7S74_02215 [Nanoarchaeota archaeon]|nr:hypothetical protein [Nanoarchaeota archaeon]
MNIKSKKRANISAIIVFFIAAVLILNVLESPLAIYSLGIAFIIAALYGIICISKNKKFIA